MPQWKPQEYCTQPREEGEGCETCSLSNYGRDCYNNPITEQAEDEAELER